MSVWVLTEEYNDYDQHGEYFVGVFESKPSESQLVACGVPESVVPHVLTGGGRVGVEYRWFHLQEHLNESPT